MDKYFVSKLELQESAVNLRSEAKAMMHMLNDKAQEKGVTLSTHIDNDLPMLFGDKRQIKRILAKVLSNAVKFTPPGGMILLNITHDYSMGFLMTVTDTGVGMDSTALATAMRNSVTKEGETNHGLPLIEVMVELHDGTLHIESSKGQGTIVSVRLPHTRTMIPHPVDGLLSAMEDLDKD